MTEPMDPIDEAIAATEAPEAPTSITNDVTLNDGRRIRLIVPFVFGPDEFETAVGMLMQLRVESERLNAPPPSSIIAPPRPALVAVDGRKLT